MSASNIGGYEEELPFAEAVFEAYEAASSKSEHFLEGPDGDFEAEIKEMLAEIRAEFGGTEEVAAG